MTAAYLSVVTQKLRLRLRMCCAHATYIYTMYTYINISSFLILSMYVRCSSLISSSLMAFFSRFVSVTLAILRGSWSMATTAAAHLSVFTESCVSK